MLGRGRQWAASVLNPTQAKVHFIAPKRKEVGCVKAPDLQQARNMPRKARDETLRQLETNQAELRKNIEASKALIAKSDQLLERYRAENEESSS